MASVSRVYLLINQKRFDLAERELRGMLSEDPDQAELHSLLAICLMQDDARLRAATEEAEMAVRLEPDNAFVHYTRSRVMLARHLITEARAAAQEAIRLDPYDADSFALLADVELNDNRWQAALTAAESGLAIDAENELCSNIRSISLERLGRTGEAMHSARETLRRAPDSSMSHTSMGWAALNSGNYTQAQESFREALRLDPNNQAARDGLVLALNNRSFVFRFVYRFYAWISRFSGKYQFAIVFGAWLAIQFVSKIGNANPTLRFIALPVMIAYFLFVLLTWIATPLFNTFLRFHSLGRFLLHRKEIWASNAIAACLSTAVVGGIYAGVQGGDAMLVILYWLLMMIPVSATFMQPTLKRAAMFAAASVVIGLMPLYGIAASLVQQSPQPLDNILPMFGWAILGIQIASGISQNTPVRK